MARFIRGAPRSCQRPIADKFTRPTFCARDSPAEERRGPAELSFADRFPFRQKRCRRDRAMCTRTPRRTRENPCGQGFPRRRSAGKCGSAGQRHACDRGEPVPLSRLPFGPAAPVENSFASAAGTQFGRAPRSVIERLLRRIGRTTDFDCISRGLTMWKRIGGRVPGETRRDRVVPSA